MSLKDIYNIKREAIRDRNWIMPFGKFKGTPLHEIIANDPQYIVWLTENTDLDFHSEIMDEIESDPLDDFPGQMPRGEMAQYYS